TPTPQAGHALLILIRMRARWHVGSGGACEPFSSAAQSTGADDFSYDPALVSAAHITNESNSNGTMSVARQLDPPPTSRGRPSNLGGLLHDATPLCFQPLDRRGCGSCLHRSARRVSGT